MVFALLAGLIFVAAIETNIGERLMGIIFPAPVGSSGPEQKDIVVPAGSGTSATNNPGRPLVTKAGRKGVIQREPAAIANASRANASSPD